jgi:hypothetical protein
VRVPEDAEVTITMKADNWAFGPAEGKPRAAAALSERPAGTEAPAKGS